MNRDPYGLGQLLYLARPNPARVLTAAAWAVGPLAEREFELAHAGCDISTFCRNPLHPGPCKGWKRDLGRLAPGALTALEKARKARVEERRVKTAEARATAAAGLTKRELASPLHAKKALHKKAHLLLGATPDKARARADRVILNKTEIARYSKMKAAQLDAIGHKYGVRQPLSVQDLANALALDNDKGRDISFRAHLETGARMMADELAKKVCQKGDGDCDGVPYEDLKKALEEGFRDALVHGDDTHLDKLLADRKAGQLLKPTGHHTYTPTAPRPARPGPVQGPARPNAAQKAHARKLLQSAPSTPAPAKAAPAAPSPAPNAPAKPSISPQQHAQNKIDNLKYVSAPERVRAQGFIDRHAAGDDPKKLATEMRDVAAKLDARSKDPRLSTLARNDARRDRGAYNEAADALEKLAAPTPAKAAPATPSTPNAPSTPAAPARTPMPSAGGPPLPPVGRVTPGLPGTTPPRQPLANRSDRLLVGTVRLGTPSSALVQEARAELKRRGLDDDGNPLPGTPAGHVPSVPNAPSAPSAPHAPAKAAPNAPSGGVSPSAPLPATASPEAKYAHGVANRTAPRAGVAKVQLNAYGKLTKADYDGLPPATQDRIRADLTDAHGKFLDPKKRAEADAIHERLTGEKIKVAHAGTAPAAPSAPAASTPSAPAAPSAPSAPAVNAPSAPNTPAAPAAPNGPSAKAVKAAELGAQIHEAATGQRMNDQAKARFAAALHDEQAKGDGKWAEAYANGAGAKIAAKTQQYLAGHSLSTGQLASLKKELADALDGKRDDTPRLDAIREAWRNAGPNAGADLSRKLDAIGAPNAPAAPAGGDALQASFDAAHKMDDEQLHNELGRMWSAHGSADAATKQRYDDFYGQVVNDPKRPAWLRLEAAVLRPNKDPKLQQAIKDAGLPGTEALGQASDPLPAYPTTYNLEDMFARVDEAKLANTPGLDLVRQAIYERRSHIVKELFRKGGTQDRVITSVASTVFKAGELGRNREPDLSRYETLDSDAKIEAKELLDRHIDNLFARRMFVQASELQTASDKVSGTTFSRPQEQAVRAMHDRTLDWQGKINAVKGLDPDEFDQLPDAHKGYILDVMEKVGANSMLNPMERMAALDEAARLERRKPDYGDPQLDSIVKQATYWNGIVDAPLRALVYGGADPAKFAQLKPGDESAVLNDMSDLTSDPNINLPTRIAVQQQFDAITRTNYHPDQRAAIDQISHLGSQISSPRNPASAPDPLDRINAYRHLDKGMYDALPDAYQRAIRDDLDGLVVTHPNEAGTVLAKLDPSWTPPVSAAPVATVTTQPHVQAALDVIYGHDPKHKQITHQLATYTALPKHDFDTLQPHEQQTALADLSFIATTSKSAATKAKAERLLDRFTPPGTPVGTPGSHPVIIAPPSAVKSQTRFPDPGGKTGLLTQSANPGQRGDEWMSVRGSTTRVWGKYGAAGLLLRHVDPQTGEQRFLIAQRGPAISNPGQWQLPGGAIESKEKPVEGATRETLEELGFKANAFDTARVHGYHEAHVGNVIGTPTGDWKYTSFAVDVDDKLIPDLSTASARAETSDARWMTLAEIEDLDRQGKILGPLAGGKLQQNIISLFPSAAQSHGLTRPGPITTRPARARPPAPPTPYKPSIAKNLIPTAAHHDDVSKLVKGSAARGRFAGKVADERLAVIHEAQGFDRTPTVMSKKQMDDLLATGDYIEIWRGVGGGGGKTAAQIAEEFRSGPSYGGFGMFGNGYYFASDKAIADNYSQGVAWRGGGGSGSAVIRALIPKSAVTMTHEKIEEEQRRHFDSALHRVRQSTKGGRTLHDEGRYASAKGVDAIEMSPSYYRRKGGGYGSLATKPVYVVQNRSILIVQEA